MRKKQAKNRTKQKMEKKKEKWKWLQWVKPRNLED